MTRARHVVGALALLLWLAVLATVISRPYDGEGSNAERCEGIVATEVLSPSTPECADAAAGRGARAVVLFVMAVPTSFGYLALQRRG